ATLSPRLRYHCASMRGGHAFLPGGGDLRHGDGVRPAPGAGAGRAPRRAMVRDPQHRPGGVDLLPDARPLPSLRRAAGRQRLLRSVSFLERARLSGFQRSAGALPAAVHKHVRGCGVMSAMRGDKRNSTEFNELVMWATGPRMYIPYRPAFVARSIGPC